MKNTKRLIVLFLATLGMANIADAKTCSGGCNYGTPSNPNWVYITWTCGDNQQCHLYCTTNPPTGGCDSSS